ncbi:choline transporter-like protein 1 [Tachypleus tridentatus]|uniref:choline transporter-like protein 1 n=1 Tax=Tachypleus tridentatus TaxID=6853 RepID=UPI003FD55AB4
MGCCGAATRVHSSQVNGRRILPDLENFEGPIRDRQCSDVIFLLLFAAFCGFLAYVLATAGGKGEPDRLLFGCDSYGNVCGKKNPKIPGASQSGKNTVSRPYLLYKPHEIPPKQCVRSCPEGEYTSSVLKRCVLRVTRETLIQQTLNITRSFF